MKLAIFVSSLDAGGAERVALNLASAFLAAGNCVDLVLVTAKGDLLAEVPDPIQIVGSQSGKGSLLDCRVSPVFDQASSRCRSRNQFRCESCRVDRNDRDEKEAVPGPFGPYAARRLARLTIAARPIAERVDLETPLPASRSRGRRIERDCGRPGSLRLDKRSANAGHS